MGNYYHCKLNCDCYYYYYQCYHYGCYHCLLLLLSVLLWVTSYIISRVKTIFTIVIGTVSSTIGTAVRLLLLVLLMVLLFYCCCYYGNLWLEILRAFRFLLFNIFAALYFYWIRQYFALMTCILLLFIVTLSFFPSVLIFIL